MLRTLAVMTCVVGMAGSAFAQTAATPKLPRHHKPVRQVIRQVRFIDPQPEQPPLTVNRRSWLDPGPVVPVGTLNNYVNDSTIFNRTPDQSYEPSKFGGEALPRPFQVPGRDVPIVEFETPAYP